MPPLIPKVTPKVTPKVIPQPTKTPYVRKQPPITDIVRGVKTPDQIRAARKIAWRQPNTRAGHTANQERMKDDMFLYYGATI